MATLLATTINVDSPSITMGGTTNAEGIRMQATNSTTYPVFLRSVNPGVGEASPWIYKEQATDWGIWHNNPVNSIDFTKQGSGGITSNVGGSSTNTVTVRVEMATGYVQTIAGYRNSAGTTILSDAGNITGNAATVTNGVYTGTTNTYTGQNYFQSNLGTTSGAINSPPLQAYATGTNAAFMSFHRAGSYAVNMGLDSDNVLRIGGWSAAANRLQLDMSGNLTVAGNMYASIFYDSDNNSYYANPAATSNFNELTLAGVGTSAYGFLKYGGTKSGDWQSFTNLTGQINVVQVENIGGGGHTNYPTGVYTYGGVMSWRTTNHSFQLYAAHTGDLAYKTQWNNDNYSGWRRILDSSSYPYAANMNQYVRTTDSPTFVDLFTSGLQIRTASPTITLRDTDHRTGFIHVNSNIFYVLTGGVDVGSGNWGIVANSRWPLEINLSNNNATFGGIVDAISFAGAGTGLTGTAASLSIGGNAANVTGTVAVANGGTGVATSLANTFFSTPNGSAGAPSFRAIVAADVPTLNQNTTGNAATATNLTTNRTNWSTNGTISAVVGQLSWKHYGNNHTIIDASNSTAPDGTAINNTNSGTAWSGTYPTLMGWNGASTYGVRVDSCRLADSATSATSATTATTTTGNAGSVTYLPSRTDSTAYPVLWGAAYTNGSGTIAYSCAAVTIQSSTGILAATSFSGAGTGLTGTASSLTAGAVSDGVYLSTTQTITGAKTFSSAITAINTAKAWVHFNGTGTIAINASHNVASLTDNGVGDYTVNFTTAMVDANYAVAGTVTIDYTSAQSLNQLVLAVPRQTNAQVAGSCRLACEYIHGAQLYDAVAVRAVFFR